MEAYPPPTWANQLEAARKLDDSDLRRHAMVSTNNNHRCTDCFCCACVTVRDERSAASSVIREQTPCS